ncbi:hypothetical protein C2D64_08475 [Listeria ivanovii]|uniref:hypothetical protein n=1 Tax=Listeria ivanovii TaxID=1638 RepID=UPI000DA8461E|nr:hypothetical protein [Listeria ivanovii]PZG33368.1 hypothetical protein C2D64_08475 [Listeria ivanovii]PZG47125.1 hypothetical protein C2D66_08245 [Listeria ivanovii]PZH11019.1 hypothetical protein C2D65_08425 [Listeria ivanovii]
MNVTIDGIIGGGLGLIGVFISLFYSTRLDKQNKDFQKQMEKSHREYDLWSKKYDTLVQMISYRYDVKCEEYSAAMNGITATFYDSKEVTDAVKKFHAYLEYGTMINSMQTNERMVNIYAAMFKDLKIDQNVDEVFLHKVFNGK